MTTSSQTSQTTASERLGHIRALVDLLDGQPVENSQITAHNVPHETLDEIARWARSQDITVRDEGNKYEVVGLTDDGRPMCERARRVLTLGRAIALAHFWANDDEGGTVVGEIAA